MNEWRLEQASLNNYTYIYFKSAGLISRIHIFKKEAALCKINCYDSAASFLHIFYFENIHGVVNGKKNIQSQNTLVVVVVVVISRALNGHLLCDMNMMNVTRICFKHECFESLFSGIPSKVL